MNKKIKIIYILSLCILGNQLISIFMDESVKAFSTTSKTYTSYTHTLILKEDGTVWSMGSNQYGELGTGDSIDRSEPTEITGLTNIVDISAGISNSIALKSDGTVWTWGNNSYGELGNNATINSSIPVKVQNLTNVIQISSAARHLMALKNDGTVWTWGFNYFGQLGDGRDGLDSLIPVQVKGIGGIGFLGNIKQIDGGSIYSMALTNDGFVLAWGQDPVGGTYVLGTNDRYGSSYPMKVENETGTGFITNIKKISTSYYHTLLLSETNEVYSFGVNDYGQLGLGNTTNYALPQKITSLANIKIMYSRSFLCTYCRQ